MTIRTKIPVRYKNPHATGELTLEMEVIENTPTEEINGNIIANSKMYQNWLNAEEEHNRPAVLIGGGASINDHIEDIRKLQIDGATVFAMNGASKWARGHGIAVDYQLILDAKKETAGLVDPSAKEHMYASQCHPDTLANAKNLTLWHLIRPGLEELFPPARVAKGGYALVGGDSSVGVCALCASYIKGYRELHIFGYDTSHRDGKGHGYKQRMNDTMPTMIITWAGEDYQMSIAMKDQVSNFMAYAQALERADCGITVYGDGLLQTIYNTNAEDLSEKDKYRLMWMFPDYREVSPGAHVAAFYVEKFKPEGIVIDFGCGTGKGSIELKELGLEPNLIDFADNCRDEGALDFPFMEWDLTEEIPAQSVHGFCTDVMEHIPTEDVDKVIKNIMDCSEKVFFQISTVDDVGGELIGATLHHTVKSHEWWLDKFKEYTITFDQDVGIASLVYVCR